MTAPAAPLHLLADDLTGAAEVAALGHARGLRAFVVSDPTDKRALPVTAEWVVHNTDSRLLPPHVTGEKIRGALRQLGASPTIFFKKTDSVLRGAVVAELTAAAHALGRSRILLVPANPSLGRIIRGGCYYVNGAPLATTAFARDPHHPARSSSVLDLLGPSYDFPVVSAKPGDPLPANGLIIGDATNAADVAAWAAQVDERTLAAGAADFCTALMEAKALKGSELNNIVPLPPGPVLFLSGTTSGASRDLLTRLSAYTLPTAHADLPALNSHLRTALAQHQLAALAPTAEISPDPLAPARLAHMFAALSTALHATHGFRHLVVEGGATSAVVLAALRWSQLELLHLWAPGVVTLRPTVAPHCCVTLKPGSYAWPAEFLALLPQPVSA